MGLRVCERNSICHELIEEVVVVRTVQRFAQCITVIIFGVNLSNINYLTSLMLSHKVIGKATAFLLRELAGFGEDGERYSLSWGDDRIVILRLE
jgi:hypothetical protein